MFQFAAFKMPNMSNEIATQYQIVVIESNNIKGSFYEWVFNMQVLLLYQNPIFTDFFKANRCALLVYKLLK